MAALYLHNAMFSQDAPAHPSLTHLPIPGPSSDPYTPKHSRHQSSQSVAPSFITSTSEYAYSHPTEPLLHPETTNSGSLAYADLLSRQPHHPSGPGPGWDMGLSLVGDVPTLPERKATWEAVIRKRLRRLRLTKGALEGLIGAWGTYNTVRYFVAFAYYKYASAQSVSLALGASTTFSIALLISSHLLALFSPHLVSTRVSSRLLHRTRVVLRYASSFFLLAPAIITFALVFVWRNASNPDLQFAQRCHWDIDVVWSPSSRCASSAPAWGAWLAASIVRLIITLLILMYYHLTCRAYAHTRRPSLHPNSHSRLRQSYMPTPAYTISPGPSSSSLAAPSPVIQTMMNGGIGKPLSLQLTQHASSSTLVSHSYSYTQGRTRAGSGSGSTVEKAADRKSLRSSRSRTGSMRGPGSSGHASRSSSDDHDAVGSAEGTVLNPKRASGGIDYGYARTHSPVEPQPSTPPQQHHQQQQAQASSSDADHEVFSFADRYRALISQVSRELDDGLDIVEHGRERDYEYDPYTQHEIRQGTQGHPPSSYSYAYAYTPEPQSYSSEALDHLTPTGPLHTQSYYDPHSTEFGARPIHSYVQPPDEHVRVLGGYIRRMPTIESLGSREVGGGSLGSSLHRSSLYRSDAAFGPGNGNGWTGAGMGGSRPPTRSNTLSTGEGSGGEMPSRNGSGSASGEVPSRNGSLGSSAATTGGHDSSAELSSASWHTAGSGSAGDRFVESPVRMDSFR